MKKINKFASLAEIRGALYHPVMVPFANDAWFFIELKTLNATEIESAGGIQVINSGVGKKHLTADEKYNIAEAEEKLCQLSMSRPTYNEILNMVVGEGFHADCKKNIELIKTKLDNAKKLPAGQRPTAAQQRAWVDELNQYEFALVSILPDITRKFITKRTSECIKMYYLQKYTYRDIAQYYKVSYQRIQQIMAHGIKQLQEMVKNEQW